MTRHETLNVTEEYFGWHKWYPPLPSQGRSSESFISLVLQRQKANNVGKRQQTTEPKVNVTNKKKQVRPWPMEAERNCDGETACKTSNNQAVSGPTNLDLRLETSP